ncbi:MAG: hypothetical protein KKG75_04440 [Nanoarchaeota archaeon]|nr:hypothetical protein [Nanoarchaeota archaeon]
MHETLNWKKLNFRCGIEIHSQLSGTKLFCSCPVITNKKEEPDLIIRRKLRAVAGESGKKDIAALYEEAKKKTFVYEFYHDCNCLVDVDSEPPHQINQKALEGALQIALLLKAKIVPKIKVMRKIILDGSVVSGFQRTMLIATNGKIKTSKGVVKIEKILLEEEAAKKISINDHEVTYRLDRIGVPLIEIATAPDIKNPEHVKETASTIGMILKSIDLSKKGLGTIRQDVNVSIKNSPRIEIKGFQDLKSIPKIIEYEVRRLIKDAPKEGEVRKAEPDLSTTFLRPLPGNNRFYPETDIREIIITKELLSKIKIPELIEEKILILEKNYNLPNEIAKEIIKNKINIKHYITKYQRVSPLLIAETLITTPKEIRARFHILPKLTQKDFEFIFENLNKQLIPKSSIIELLIELSKGKTPNLEKYKSLPDKEVEKIIEKIIAENKDAPFNALMGIAMSKLKNKIDGKKIAEIIKKFQ